jgi:hypothetical protein
LLLLAAVGAIAGSGRPALVVALTGASTLAFVWAWTSRTATSILVASGVVAAAFLVEGEPTAVVVGVLLFVLALFLLVLYNAVSSLLVSRRLAGVELERVGPDDAVMPTSREFATEFEAEGFRCVGGYRWRDPLRGKLVTTTVLAGPDRDRLAVVTEEVREVVSLFGGRSLTTISSGIAALPPWALRQIVRGRPAEQAAAHQTAVELLARREVVPDRFDSDDEAVEGARVVEDAWNRFVAAAPARKVVYLGFDRSVDDAALADDDRSRRRIDAWLASEPFE